MLQSLTGVVIKILIIIIEILIIKNIIFQSIALSKIYSCTPDELTRSYWTDIMIRVCEGNLILIHCAEWCVYSKYIKQ